MLLIVQIYFHIIYQYYTHFNFNFITISLKDIDLIKTISLWEAIHQKAPNTQNERYKMGPLCRLFIYSGM
jgi:hypothetical protein